MEHRTSALRALEGLISEDVGLYLRELAYLVPPSHAIVEIGSFKGKSTCYIADGYQGGVGVFAVDPWDLPGNQGGKHNYTAQETRDTFDAQVFSLGLQEVVHPIRQFSREAAAEWNREIPIGMLFIDGSHTYDDVKADYLAWSVFVVSEGIVAFDDYRTKRNPGVTRFVDELRDGAVLYDWDDSVSPLAVARKR